MKPFEHYLAHIETTLGVPLCDWQKQVLHALYEGKHPIYARPGRGGKMVMIEAAKLLQEEMEKEN